MTTFYRAQYQTRQDRTRRFTFAHSGGIKAAHSFAQSWECADDRLVAVCVVRELRPAYPLFNLEAQA